MKSKFSAKLFFIILFLLGSSFGIFLYFKENNATYLKEIITLATTKTPESFTELYFEDHTKLPKLIYLKSKGTEDKFKFTIHNLENKDMENQFSVYTITGDIKTTVQTDKVFLKRDESITIETNTGLLKLSRTQVVVELTNTKQSISFWTEPPKPTMTPEPIKKTSN